MKLEPPGMGEHIIEVRTKVSVGKKQGIGGPRPNYATSNAL